jgi:hypothetical protein
MNKPENLLDIVKEVLLIRETNPDFRITSLPKENEQYLAHLAVAFTKMLDQFPDKSLQLKPEDARITQRYLAAISRAVSKGDGEGLNAICTELANSYEKTDKVCEDCKHDGDCIASVVSMAWWSWLVCATTLACVTKHMGADIGRDRLFAGHCDDEGSGVCKCIQISFSLSAVLLLISIILFFFGGPVIGTAGREMIRQMVLRLAPAA